MVMKFFRKSKNKNKPEPWNPPIDFELIDKNYNFNYLDSNGIRVLFRIVGLDEGSNIEYYIGESGLIDRYTGGISNIVGYWNDFLKPGEDKYYYDKWVMLQEPYQDLVDKLKEPETLNLVNANREPFLSEQEVIGKHVSTNSELWQRYLEGARKQNRPKFDGYRLYQGPYESDDGPPDIVDGKLKMAFKEPSTDQIRSIALTNLMAYLNRDRQILPGSDQWKLIKENAQEIYQKLFDEIVAPNVLKRGDFAEFAYILNKVGSSVDLSTITFEEFMKYHTFVQEILGEKLFHTSSSSLAYRQYFLDGIKERFTVLLNSSNSSQLPQIISIPESKISLLFSRFLEFAANLRGETGTYHEDFYNMKIYVEPSFK